MAKRYVWSLFVPVLGFLTQSCVATASNQAATKENRSVAAPTAEGAQLAGRWQKEWLDTLASRSEGHQYQEAWGLFSQGGYVDAGQVLVYASADLTAQIELVPPAGSRRERRAQMTAEGLRTFREELSPAETLRDLDEPIFDGMRYEYVHAKLDPNGQPRVLRRIYMNNPSASAGGAGHRALVEVFRRLAAPTPTPVPTP